MKTIHLLFLAATVVAGPFLQAATYYSDPAKGKAGNSGSESAPWPGLEETATAGLLAKLSGGDTLLLRSGYHGEVKFGGDNSSPVTIAAAEGATPKLGSLTLSSGKNWIVRNLSISPSHAGKTMDGYIVSLGEGGTSSDITIENCYVFGAEDTGAWGVKEWMSAPRGILLGRHGTNLTARNNHLLNLRFGISVGSPHSLVEGNIVSDFSGDGIRVTRDDITVAYNVIKNIYVSGADGDANHDDAIQCFLFGKGTGTVRNAKIHHNYIFMRENPQQAFPASFQGVGLFDGPLVDFEVHHNVIATSTWHGVSLFDAQGCVISDNVVYNPWGGKFTPWIMLGTKLRQAHGNEVKDNYAHRFKFDGDKEAKNSGNEKVTEEIYEKRAKELLEEIDRKFGETHPVSGKKRMNKS